MAQLYINQFKMRLDEGAGDDELNAIIEEVSDIIEDNDEYHKFYDAVMKLYREAIR